ncbi:gliding motility-associated peptidyl-prolyl isomerase GldI [Flavobacterium sp.]|jgi:gliding motility-associated peptidyl-prolyl isomerase|uniref:gliding motility-associated peptidyl-prolyl isomerase GldI n=1 Tax=Flavobacterium sp. TaxID=239 RepID=UPI002A82887D|nr:gliding motility-associated peptidyl-prolyl isomerase GldI [Flavobacterium sp.]
MNIRSLLTILFLGILFTSCSKQQARKPVSQTSGTFIQESIDRNKKLIAEEEQLIENIISNDTLKEYIASSKGYWYKYDVKTENDTILPKRGDIAYFNYEIRDLKNKIIYTQEELQPQEYFVDKENIMMGLRDGIKLMKKGETITFLFPSHMAFGYHGDNEKIGSNEPLICIVTINEIKKETPKTERTN